MKIVRMASAILLLQLPAICQLSPTAYRALGQPDMRQNGVNQVQAAGLHGPMGVALDDRDGGLHLYIADTNNNRVLAWRDARSYQAGDPPALVLGQPTSYHSGYLGIGEKGLAGPVSLAVDPTNGNLYVADLLNHRVLRFLSPFANELRV
jgi:DNA-binding beta-propeller fold protein YncE